MIQPTHFVGLWGASRREISRVFTEKIAAIPSRKALTTSPSRGWLNHLADQDRPKPRPANQPMNFLRRLFSPSKRPSIRIDFNSFSCVFEENINLSQRMRAKGMFAVTLNKGGTNVKHLVLGVNEKLLKDSKNEGILASLRMIHNASGQPEPALVQLWSDGTVRALDSNDSGIPLESLDFCPDNTTYLGSTGARIEQAPSRPTGQPSVVFDSWWNLYYECISNALLRANGESQCELPPRLC